MKAYIIIFPETAQSNDATESARARIFLNPSKAALFLRKEMYAMHGENLSLFPEEINELIELYNAKYGDIIYREMEF